MHWQHCSRIVIDTQFVTALEAAARAGRVEGGELDDRVLKLVSALSEDAQGPNTYVHQQMTRLYESHSTRRIFPRHGQETSVQVEFVSPHTSDVRIHELSLGPYGLCATVGNAQDAVELLDISMSAVACSC